MSCHAMSNVKSQMSNVKCQMSNVKCQMSKVKSHMSHSYISRPCECINLASASTIILFKDSVYCLPSEKAVSVRKVKPS